MLFGLAACRRRALDDRRSSITPIRLRAGSDSAPYRAKAGGWEAIVTL